MGALGVSRSAFIYPRIDSKARPMVPLAIVAVPALALAPLLAWRSMREPAPSGRDSNLVETGRAAGALFDGRAAVRR
jgi:hypothetical protein